MTETTEGILIGRLLVEPSQVPTLSGRLTADDFSDRSLGEAWEAMERLAAKGRPVDLVTLRSEGVELDDPTRWLSSLHTAPVSEYVDIIRRSAFKSNVLGELGRLTSRVRSHDDPADIIGDVQRAVSGILADTGDAGDLVSLSSVVERDVRNGLAYGIPGIDRHLHPAQPGDVIIVAARPSIGKTAFAWSVAEAWAFESPTPVLFVSLEMPASKLLRRALKHHDRSDLSAFNLTIYDAPRATTGLVRAQAARLRLRHGGIRAIVVDYLGLLKDTGGGDSENLRVARMSGEVKAIAREFECPALLLSQLNRQAEYRKDPRPKLSDLRDSGAIEQDADAILGLYRPNRSDPVLQVRCLKDRDGLADWEVMLDFDLEGQTVGGGE